MALITGAPMINRGRFRLFAGTTAEYSTGTLDLVGDSTVIDMLGLLTLDFRKLSAWQLDPRRFQDSDYQPLKSSGITIFHPAVGYTEGDVYAASLRDITGWNSFIRSHPEKFLRVDSAASLEQIKTSGKIGIVIGQQNSAHFRSVDDVDRFYRLGQRVSQLTYVQNRLGGGSSDAYDSGLTPYGGQVIERMNAVGMAVDVSHCADRTTLEAIDISRKPVLVTHSNCRALVPAAARCKTDGAIRRLASKGGVMGITMIRFFVRAQGPATINDVLDHIDHVVKLVGVEHVGVGTDVDLVGRDRGAHPAPRADLDGLRYARKIFDLTEGLLRRKYARRDIELILGGNFQRALAEIWTV